MDIRSNEQLLASVNRGKKAKYTFFWGHQEKGSAITKSCFSQWYGAVFQEDGLTFKSAEHYMMYHKAKLFDDQEAAQRALEAKNPGAAKAIGREVRGFSQSVWEQHRFDIVVNANHAKFSQDFDLKDFLLRTNNRVLVEASPVDKIWGIGLAQDDEKAQNPNLWKGLNLLGYALMEVRERLSTSSKD